MRSSVTVLAEPQTAKIELVILMCLLGSSGSYYVCSNGMYDYFRVLFRVFDMECGHVHIGILSRYSLRFLSSCLRVVALWSVVYVCVVVRSSDCI